MDFSNISESVTSALGQAGEVITNRVFLYGLGAGVTLASGAFMIYNRNRNSSKMVEQSTTVKEKPVVETPAQPQEYVDSELKRQHETRIREMELELKHREDLQIVVSRVRSELDAARGELAVARAKLREVEDDVMICEQTKETSEKAYKQRIEELTNEINALNNDLDTMRADLRQTNINIAKQRERIVNTENERSSVERELSEAKSTIKALQENLAKHTKAERPAK